MSYLEKATIIGKIGTIGLMNGLTIEVKVLDYKNSYGKDRWQVEPVAGSGKIWVEWVNIKD